MKKRILFICSILLTIFLIAAVSAFWPFTGKVVDNTAVSNTAKCNDSDGGVYSFVAGYVKYNGVVKGVDYCGPSNPLVWEAYCTSGSWNWKSITCAAGCEKVVLLIDGKNYTSGRCLPAVAPTPAVTSCTAISGGVKDQTGKKFLNGCGTGANSKIYTSYTCNGSSVLTATTDCALIGQSGRCTSGGCAGNCNDDEVNNSKDVPGKVVADGKNYLDKCSSDNQYVQQFKCVNGKAEIVEFQGTWWTPCGADKVCAIDNNGKGYCRDKIITEVTSVEGLRKIIQAMQETIDELEDRIEALEEPAEP